MICSRLYGLQSLFKDSFTLEQFPRDKKSMWEVLCALPYGLKTHKCICVMHTHAYTCGHMNTHLCMYTNMCEHTDIQFLWKFTSVYTMGGNS